MKLYSVFSVKRKSNITLEIDRYYIFIPDFLNFINEPWKYSGLKFKKNNFTLNVINQNCYEDLTVTEITSENAEEHYSELYDMLSAIKVIENEYFINKSKIQVLYLSKELKNLLRDLILEIKFLNESRMEVQHERL